MFCLNGSNIMLKCMGGNNISLIVVLKFSFEFFGFIENVLFNIVIMYGIIVVLFLVLLSKFVNYFRCVLFLKSSMLILRIIFIKIGNIDVMIRGLI